MKMHTTVCICECSLGELTIARGQIQTGPTVGCCSAGGGGAASSADGASGLATAPSACINKFGAFTYCDLLVLKLDFARLLYVTNHVPVQRLLRRRRPLRRSCRQRLPPRFEESADHDQAGVNRAKVLFQNIDSTALPDPIPPPIFAHFPLRPSQQK